MRLDYGVADYQLASEAERQAVTEWLDEHMPHPENRYCTRAVLTSEGVVEVEHMLVGTDDRPVLREGRLVHSVALVRSAIPFPGFARTMREADA